MIDKILQEVKERYLNIHEAEQYGISAEEALTAIYEIGLGCIGADETPPKMIKHYPGAINVMNGAVFPASSEEVYYHPETYAKNQLRASQRKAWAKACGVAEK